MNENTLLMILIAIGSCIFIIGFIMRRMDVIIRIAARGLLGSAVIWGVGMLMRFLGLPVPVGLNIWTAGISGLLGLPGLTMLYMIGMYGIL